MFETSRRRRHPLNSFRFWFLIFGAMALSVAWKFDLLPFHIGPAETGQLAQDAFTDVDQPSNAAPQQSAEPEVALPFSDGDESFALPTIAPTPTLSRTAAGDWAVPAPLSAELPPSEFAPLGPASTSTPPPLATSTGSSSAGRAAFDDWDDDDWPTQTATAPAGNFVPANLSPILQTGATTSSFAAATGRSVETPAGPFEAADIPAVRPLGIDFTNIDALLATGLPADEIEAHRLLSTIYWQQPESRPALRQRIDTLAQNIYFLNSRHYMDAYQVQAGDTLQKIARQYDVSWQYLAKLNRVDPKRVRAGQRLKVIKGPFSAIIDLSDYELSVHAHGYFVTRFPVGIGKDGSTPVGKFSVQEKLIDPTYYGPDRVIAHDDPLNPLGERWIDLGDSYGIHGTIDPTSIGKNESRGCIRLHNDDAAAVYDLLMIGSEVTIRP